jgi:hypothetical protein
MALPPLQFSMSDQLSSNAGAGYGSGTVGGGTVNFGGSGMGGAVGGGFNIGAMVSQYWPLLAVAGAIWYFRRQRAR